MLFAFVCVFCLVRGTYDRSGFFAGRTMEETGSLPDKETVDK